jgi:hypothetical protein
MQTTAAVRILIRLALAALVVALVAPAAPAQARAKPGCPDNGVPVVDVTLQILNVDDVGLDGHVWALDDIDQRMRIWQTGSNRYCVRLDDVGTFTTFAGVSPNLTGTVSEGVTGTVETTSYLRATGTFAPTVPTTGHIGTVDADCQQDGTCATFGYRFTNLYFSRVDARSFGWYSATYDGGSHGLMVQSTDGNSGDITG